MAEANRILVKMLERLRANLLNGPALNCRPHQSRQRIDFKQFEKLEDISAAKLLLDLIGAECKSNISVRFAKGNGGTSGSSLPAGTEQTTDTPSNSSGDGSSSQDAGESANSPSVQAENGNGKRKGKDSQANALLLQQQSLLQKLRLLTEDARVHEQDTGTHVLYLGFPLLNLPPEKGKAALSQRRILAPIAFIPVTVNIKTRPRTSIEIACCTDGVDRVTPNPSLFAWLEQSGRKLPAALFDDETGQDPWREMSELTRWVAETLEIAAPQPLTAANLPTSDELELAAAPRTDDGQEPAIITAAVLGLFPINNQALIRDTEAMLQGEALEGPVRSFLDVAATLDSTEHEYAPAQVAEEESQSTELVSYLANNERLISSADPCQARAVRLARSTAGLVIHGPPGTGKSQTITNIVGDHLVRGERVLVVCDKRTALDVVADRLNHLGLGSLVAVVHDPGRDQRELYRSVREQLEKLSDTRTNSQAEGQITQIDRELDAIRAELATARQLLQVASHSGDSFHDLMGQWLAASLDDDAQAAYAKITGDAVSINRQELAEHSRDIRDILQKAEAVQYGDNPWSHCAGLSLDDLLSQSGDDFRIALRKALAAAIDADATTDPNMPVFRAEGSLDDQVRARAELADHLDRLGRTSQHAIVEHWIHATDEAREQGYQRLTQASPMIDIFRQGPLDAELWCLWGSSLPVTAELAQQVGQLDQYLSIAKKWYGVFCFSQRAKAREVLAKYGMAADSQSAQRLHGFLRGCQVRRVLQVLLASLHGRTESSADSSIGDDTKLAAALEAHQHSLAAFHAVQPGGPLEPILPQLIPALKDRAVAEALVDGLRDSAARVAGIQRLEAELRDSHLFRDAWLQRVHQQFCQGKKAAGAINTLLEKLPTCETVLRIQDALVRLTPTLRVALGEILKRGIAAEPAFQVLEKLAREHAIKHRLATLPELQRLDGERLAHNIERYRNLRSTKHEKVAAAALHRWVQQQRERLLVSTGSRLNSEGADVRRRLTIQGDRALRLRKVLEIGTNIEGGDPLFDLRPVWMASPETVAQIFARRPLFDVIVFDEASQCRLEEALPVLTRGQRVVIAGDTKQLPPTRFFETAVITSEEDAAETEQDWFEIQQGEVEDLLTAALNLQIEQCYLDVHYRSRNADLISFSNDQFYASRLQPIPGHPRNRTRFAPITLNPVQGIYEDRTNRVEAEAVCKIVHDLLRRAEPPSIGIACFNTDQRDLIIECLNDLANLDVDFAHRLAEARSRKGASSSEGLFVKNLENVQGDERDHIVISTTYGPDPNGRFYRRFGPLGRAGGGRRLNVLVTRARHEVHLVSSIPSTVYRDIPPLQPGQTPNGAWLLFSYLAYAEQLAQVYAHSNAELDQRDEQAAVGPTSVLPPRVDEHPSTSPSRFAKALAHELARKQGQRSVVHWGNDGFCVDVAIGHPRFVEDVTIGLLCDLNRYHRADDPLDWEIFRTDILEATGWQLQRIWTPQFFRDSIGVCQRVVTSVNDYLAKEEAKDALRVSPR